MSEIRYSKDHEYVRVEGDVAVIGISAYAQEKLGDVVFVELPAIGANIEQHKEAAVVESVKAASEVFAPVSGEVLEVNDALEANPALANEAPEGEGWFLKLRMSDPAQLNELMSADAYQDFLKTLG